MRRSSTESKFLQASKAFQVGKSIMPDDEYDRLKKELRKKGSKVTAQARCVPPLLSRVVALLDPLHEVRGLQVVEAQPHAAVPEVRWFIGGESWSSATWLGCR